MVLNEWTDVGLSFNYKQIIYEKNLGDSALAPEKLQTRNQV